MNDLKAMIAARILVGKMGQGLKASSSSPMVKESVDIAEAILAEVAAREAKPAADVIVPPAP